MLSVTRGMVSQGDVNLYKRSFIQVIEDSLQYIITDPSTEKHGITPHNLLKYRGDFYGLLLEMGYRSDMHWIILRTNGMVNSMDFNFNIEEIILPSREYMNRILLKHMIML